MRSGRSSSGRDRSERTRALPIAHRRGREVRPDVGTAPAAALANEPRLKIGQAHFTRPFVAADRYVMTAFVIGAIDQEPANAGRAHLGEGIFWARSNVNANGRLAS